MSMKNQPKNSFILNEIQMNLLINNVSNHNIHQTLLEAKKKGEVIKKGFHTNKFLIVLNANDKELLLDQITSLLISKGFKEEYEPNRIGLELENIIDIITQKDY